MYTKLSELYLSSKRLEVDEINPKFWPNSEKLFNNFHRSNKHKVL